MWRRWFYRTKFNSPFHKFFLNFAQAINSLSLSGLYSLNWKRHAVGNLIFYGIQRIFSCPTFIDGQDFVSSTIIDGCILINTSSNFANIHLNSFSRNLVVITLHAFSVSSFFLQVRNIITLLSLMTLKNHDFFLTHLNITSLIETISVNHTPKYSTHVSRQFHFRRYAHPVCIK